MRSTHISVIHRAWDTRIFYKECRALADAGYETHLLIGGPANPDPVDGVHVHSLSDDPGRPPARRQWRRLTRAMRLALALRPSIYHLHDPHLIPLGVVLKALGAHVVYDRHEDFPAHARSKLPGRPVRAWLKASMWVALEWIAARTFDGFVCASPDLVRPLPAGSTIVVNNYPLRRLFAEDDLRMFESSPVYFRCRCSRERVAKMLVALGREEVESVLAERGSVEVRCEFCGRAYEFDPVDCAQLFTTGASDPPTRGTPH